MQVKGIGKSIRKLSIDSIVVVQYSSRVLRVPSLHDVEMEALSVSPAEGSPSAPQCDLDRQVTSSELGFCWNTAAVARPQSFSPYTGVAGVLGCRRCRSRLPSVLEHHDPSSRLSISLRIFRVFGSIEFSRLCIYMGLVAR